MSANKPLPITVANGDGIGPDIMSATLEVLSAAGASLVHEFVSVGEAAYLAGNEAGISKEDWVTILRNKVFLKAPITTPQGGGYKSLNVTIRKTLGLFSNVRPCFSYYPFAKTNFPKLDVVIIRENEEDLYMGIEHYLSKDIAQAKKIITRQGCEKIVRYAFEYAVKNDRKRVTCMTKDNIMKLTDGMFHAVFDAIAKQYPSIENEHYIIDIGSARLASRPESFDVVVTENLYGDIISDIVAEVSGSVGLAGSANIGQNYAMFEAIHGSAPTMAGQNRANPSGLINAGIMMLAHVGQGQAATKLRNALLYTIESGEVTKDLIHQEGQNTVGTKEFAQAVCRNMGKTPTKFPIVKYPDFEFSNEITPDTSSKQGSPSFVPNIGSRECCDVMGLFEGTTEKVSNLFKEANLQDICKKSNITLSGVFSKGIAVMSATGDIISNTPSELWRCAFEAPDNMQRCAFLQEIVSNILPPLSEKGFTAANIQPYCK